MDRPYEFREPKSFYEAGEISRYSMNRVYAPAV